MEKVLLAQAEEIRGSAGEDVSTYQYTPSDEHLKNTRGVLFAFVRNNQKSEKALEENKKFLDLFKENYFQPGGSNLKILENAVDQIAAEVKKEEKSINLVVAILWGSVLYIGKIGDGQTVLIRGGRAKTLSFYKAASGNLSENDQLLLGDSLFTQAIGSLEEVKSSESLVKHLKQKIDGKDAAALFVGFSVSEAEITSEAEQMEGVNDGNIEFKEDIDLVPEEKKERSVSLSLVLAKTASIILPIFENLKPLVAKALASLLTPWKSGNHLSKEARKRARILQIGGLLVSVLIISLAVGSLSNRISSSREQKEQNLTLAEQKLSDAENLKNIDQARAASLLADARSALSKIESSEKKRELEEKLRTLTAEINRVYKADLKQEADFSGLKSGANVEEMVLLNGQIIFLDKGNASLYKLEGGEEEILGTLEDEASSFAETSSGVYVFSSSGIRKFEIANKTETKVSNPSDLLQEIIESSGYRNNFYLLDKKAKQVWKYAPGANGLSGPTKYLTQTLDAEPTSMAIDGGIWLASKDKITKYLAGRETSFELKNLALPLTEINKLYTNEKNSSLYVLDKKVGLVVLDKESGEFLAAYELENPEKVDDLLVDEGKKTVYLLKENQLSTFTLK